MGVRVIRAFRGLAFPRYKMSAELTEKRNHETHELHETDTNDDEGPWEPRVLRVQKPI